LVHRFINLAAVLALLCAPPIEALRRCGPHYTRDDRVNLQTRDRELIAVAR